MAASSTAGCAAAVAMALISGLMLFVMGLLRFGFLASFLSHPVVSGFITASGILSASASCAISWASTARGDTHPPELLASLSRNLADTNAHQRSPASPPSPSCSGPPRPCSAAAALFGKCTGRYARQGQAGSYHTGSTLANYYRGLRPARRRAAGRRGAIRPGIPSFDLGGCGPDLALPALLISIIGFVESVSVGKTLAAKRRQRIDPQPGLIALGAANMASGVSGGFPVTGGFSPLVVNFDAGAEETPAAVAAAIGIALAALLLTPVLYYLPKAALAATIIVAVSTLVETSP